MSAQPIEGVRPLDVAPVGPAPEVSTPAGAAPGSPDPDAGPGASAPGSEHPHPEPARSFDVRPNPAVSAVIGALAAAVGTAYLWRAVGNGALVDWALCLLLGAIAVAFLRSLLDSRTPLVVADELGVRVRLGAQWRAMPWDAVDRVVVTPRRGWLRDGRLAVHVFDPQRALEGLDRRALRHARLNRRVYGTVLAVPLGPTTRVSGQGDLADRVGALAGGQAEVVTLLGVPGGVTRAAAATGPATETTVVAAGDPAGESAGESGTGAVSAAEGGADRSAGAGAHSTVRSFARRAEPVARLEVREFELEPATDPVIGPELAGARTRLGLTVDELAERTRIRPHVIESIEVDDFIPCGGDFYARGHIRTLARVLGKDPEPLLGQFEARYATAPITARMVFEAELATGLTGTIRGTGVGGPHWGLLIGVVLVLVLAWSGVRLFAGEGEVTLEVPPPIAAGSAGAGTGFGQPRPAVEAPPVPVSVRATNAGAGVQIRNGDGDVVFEGDLVIGEVARVEVDPPVTISSDNGGAVAVTLGAEDAGLLGPADQPATRVFQRPDR